MADHDELCPATIADGRWRARCECALIARVRADEDAKNTAARAELYVELDRVRRERDAARAEVAALREEVAHAWAVANGEARR